MAEQFNIRGERNIIAGHDVIKSIINTGDYARFFVGDYERLRDVYIEPWSVFLRVDLEHFVGREWLIAKIDTFLHENDRGYFVLEAEAGLGKTTFLAWLVRERGYIHHFAELAPGLDGIGRGLKHIAAQLVLAYHLNVYEAEDTLPGAAVRPDYLFRLLRQATQQRVAGEKIVLVIDALDELGVPGQQNVLGLPAVLSEGVYIIVSQRPVPVPFSIDTAITPRSLFRLTADNRHNQEDMRLFLENAAIWPGISHALLESGYTSTSFVEHLLEKCHGVWIYLHYIVFEIDRKERSPLNLDALPDGMTQYYVRYWQHWRMDDEERWYQDYLPLLATLAAVQEASELERLVVWSEVKLAIPKLRRLLHEQWRPFIALVEQRRYRFYHATLREFFEGSVEWKKLTESEISLVEELTNATREAHRHIVKYYLALWGGIDNNLSRLATMELVEGERSYGLHYITKHLEAAGQIDVLHALLMLEKDDHHNIWYQAKERSSDVSGYIADITRAWQLAEESFQYETSEIAATELIGHLIHYALILASLRSKALNIPYALLTALVEKRLWPPEQALAYALQNADISHRADALKAILPFLPKTLLTQILAAIQPGDPGVWLGIGEEMQWLGLIKEIVIRLADEGDIELALQTVRSLPIEMTIADQITPVEMLVHIASLMPDTYRKEVVREAYDRACSIHANDDRVRALSLLLPYFSKDLWIQLRQEVLFNLKTMNLAQWIEYMPLEVRDKIALDVFDVAITMKDGRQQANAMKELIRYLSGPQRRRAIRIIRQTVQDFWPKVRQCDEHDGILEEWEICEIAQMLIAVIPFLTPAQREETTKRILIAFRLILFWEAEDVQWLGDIVLTPFRSTEEFLRSVVKMLPQKWQSQVLHKLMVMATTIEDNNTHAWALAILIPFVSVEQRREVTYRILTTVHKIEHAEIQLDILKRLIPFQEGKECKDTILYAEKIMQRIGNSTNVLNAHILFLIQILPCISDAIRDEVLSKILEECFAMNDVGIRREFITRLVPYVSDAIRDEVLSKILEECFAINDVGIRREFITQLIPYMTISQIRETLPLVLEIRDSLNLVQGLSVLLPYLSTSLQEEVLNIIKNTCDSQIQATLILPALPYLQEKLREHAIDGILAIREVMRVTSSPEGYRLGSIPLSFIPQLIALGYTDILMEMSSKVEDRWWHGELLAQVVVSLAGRDPITAFAYIEQYGLGKVIPHPPDSDKLKAIEQLSLGEIGLQGWALARIVTHLPVSMLKESLVIGKKIGEKRQHAGTLLCIASRLSDSEQNQLQNLLKEAFKNIKELNGENQMDLFSIIAPYLSAQIIEEALIVVQNFRDDYARLRISALLSIYLPEPRRSYLFNQLLDELEVEPYSVLDTGTLLDEIAPFLDVTLVRKAFKLPRDKNITAIHKLARRLADLGYFQEAVASLLNIPFDETNSYFTFNDAAYKQLNQQVKSITQYFAELRAIEIALNDDKAFVDIREHLEKFWKYQMCASIAYILVKAGNLEQALRVIWLIDNNLDKVHVISSLGPHIAELPRSDYTLCFRQLLHYSSSLPRKDFMSIFPVLIPLIIALGGKKGVEKTAEAIQDVGLWWP